MEYDVLIVGCGLSGAVCARQFADMGKKVCVLERRNHIGGNMYDYKNKYGILVHKYGPHTFHTNKRMLYEYICRYARWKEYQLYCGTIMNGRYTQVPFNFETIDIFYSKTEADKIKRAFKYAYPSRKTASVLELLQHPDQVIQDYAVFLYENDYRPYTAKQWGINPKDIDPSVLKRVPIRIGYGTGYFDDTYQVMPVVSYTNFFKNLLDCPNIEVQLNTDAGCEISLDEKNGNILYHGRIFKGYVIYTGPVDELFQRRYGVLPYRSLEFEWRTEQVRSLQNAPVVAYPQAEEFTRITEYTKLPMQNVGNITTYAVEYPVSCKKDWNVEPYYPILTADSKERYANYRKLADRYKKLYLCGRLADFQYYNMDQALEKALDIVEKIRCSVMEG